MHLESMEMIIFPTKRDLDYPVQTKKRQIAANQQASPNHRRYIPEADLQTVSDKRSRFRHAPKATGSAPSRSEEHTSELQSLMRISYAVFCLKKKNTVQVIARQFI